MIVLPNTNISWIYEGLDPNLWENATGTVINRSGKQLDENIRSLQTQVQAELDKIITTVIIFS